MSVDRIAEWEDRRGWTIGYGGNDWDAPDGTEEDELTSCTAMPPLPAPVNAPPPPPPFAPRARRAHNARRIQ